MFLKTITRWFSREEFTGPGAYNELMRIAYPLILMSASNVVMQFADRKFLGNSSTAEMAAAMLPAPISTPSSAIRGPVNPMARVFAPSA